MANISTKHLQPGKYSIMNIPEEIRRKFIGNKREKRDFTQLKFDYAHVVSDSRDVAVSLSRRIHWRHVARHLSRQRQA